MLTDSDDYSYSLDLVEDTKRRLRSLEAEAQVGVLLLNTRLIVVFGLSRK